eukprot:g2169.t1
MWFRIQRHQRRAATVAAVLKKTIGLSENCLACSECFDVVFKSHCVCGVKACSEKKSLQPAPLDCGTFFMLKERHDGVICALHRREIRRRRRTDWRKIAPQHDFLKYKTADSTTLQAPTYESFLEARDIIKRRYEKQQPDCEQCEKAPEIIATARTVQKKERSSQENRNNTKGRSVAIMETPEKQKNKAKVKTKTKTKTRETERLVDRLRSGETPLFFQTIPAIKPATETRMTNKTELQRKKEQQRAVDGLSKISKDLSSRIRLDLKLLKNYRSDS